MRIFIPNFLTLLALAGLLGCGNAEQHAQEGADTTSNEMPASNSDMISQRITPCLWVETKDAKAVADYYLSIFKDGKLKEHH